MWQARNRVVFEGWEVSRSLIVSEVFSPLLPIGIFPEFMARKVLGGLYYGTSGFLLRWVYSLLLEIPQECSSYG
ncbi:hypothetical protein L6452_19143 [Arctium lappa]|uniref:Uncharacterized protein n=1 Tax=Arctium lappa TaxID=4217 RepID=A0ACB9B7C8_ARCLA|nr:hypothetical protein L6452_19143 [Arctium lappa]